MPWGLYFLWELIRVPDYPDQITGTHNSGGSRFITEQISHIKSKGLFENHSKVEHHSP